MADPNTPTSRAILKAIHASLGLVASSSELFTYSQLCAVRDDLKKALAIVDGKTEVIRTSLFLMEVLEYLVTNPFYTGKKRLIIDLSDWDTSSDEDETMDGTLPARGCSLFFF